MGETRWQTCWAPFQALIHGPWAGEWWSALTWFPPFLFLSSPASQYLFPCAPLSNLHPQSPSWAGYALCHTSMQLVFLQKKVHPTSRKWKKSHSPGWSQNKRKKTIGFWRVYNNIIKLGILIYIIIIIIITIYNYF